MESKISLKQRWHLKSQNGQRQKTPELGRKGSKRSLLTYFACNKTEWPAQKEENITILTLEPRSDAGMQETQAGDAKSGEKSNQELRGGHCCEARPTSLCRRGLEADWPHHTTPFQSHTWAAALSTTFLAQCSPPNFFLCGTPFAKCCTFLSHLPIHVQRGNSSISGWFWNHKQTNLHFSVLPCICWNVKCQMTKSKLAIWGMAAHVPGWSSGSCSIMGGTLTLKAISPLYRYSSSSKDYF